MCFLSGWQLRSKLGYFYGGVIAGVAYLIRPEGIGYLAVVPLTEIVRWFLADPMSVPPIATFHLKTPR